MGLHNAAKGRAKKSRGKERKEKSFGLLAPTDNPPTDVQ